MKNPVPIFQGDIVDRKLKLFHRVEEAIKRYLMTFPNGTKLDIIFRKHKEKRSDLQNNYYFGVVVPILAKHFGYDIDEMHEELKILFNPVKSKIDPDRTIGGSTKKMAIEDFFVGEESYVGRICRWAAMEHSLYIPEPDKAYWEKR